jgi:hypothetical protein
LHVHIACQIESELVIVDNNPLKILIGKSLIAVYAATLESIICGALYLFELVSLVV